MRDENDRCTPCRMGVPRLADPEMSARLAELGPGWRIVDGHHLEKEFRFRNFTDALTFTNRVGDLAENEGHHPEVRLAWGRVTIAWWTHKSDGLTDNDFRVASKTDAVFSGDAGTKPVAHVRPDEVRR